MSVIYAVSILTGLEKNAIADNLGIMMLPEYYTCGSELSGCPPVDPGENHVLAGHLFVDSLCVLRPDALVSGKNHYQLERIDTGLHHIHVALRADRCTDDWSYFDTTSFDSVAQYRMSLGKHKRSSMYRIDKQLFLFFHVFDRYMPDSGVNNEHIVLVSDGNWRPHPNLSITMDPDSIFSHYRTVYPGRPFPRIHVLSFAEVIDDDYPECEQPNMHADWLRQLADTTGGTYTPVTQYTIIPEMLNLLGVILPSTELSRPAQPAAVLSIPAEQTPLLFDLSGRLLPNVRRRLPEGVYLRWDEGRGRIDAVRRGGSDAVAR